MPKGHYNRKSSRKSSQPSPQTGSPEPQQTVTQVRPANIDNGEAARGSTNARTNQTRTQPEPEAAVRAMGTVVALRGGTGSRANVNAIAAEMSEELGRKAQIESEARQKLAQAVELIGQGAEKEKEAAELIDGSSLLFYNLRTQNLISADGLTAALGDQFGFKSKKNKDIAVPANHPDASKTPFKRGEAIRKRIVRAVQANEYVNGRDGGAFFTELPKQDVQATLTAMTTGDTGFWAAYEAFADIKRKFDAAKTRVDPAYDPKRVAAMAEKLNNEGAAKAFASNPELGRAYVLLIEMVDLALEGAKKAA